MTLTVNIRRGASAGRCSAASASRGVGLPLLLASLLLPALGPLVFVAPRPPANGRGARATRATVARQQAASDALHALPVVDVAAMKAQLRRGLVLGSGPTETAIAFLEGAWRPARPLMDLAPMQGEWVLQVPQGGNMRAWMVQHGARLGMELKTEPLLNIAPDGRGLWNMQLKWGPKIGRVTAAIDYAISGPNQITATPRTIRSGRLGVPVLMRPRSLHIVYLDDELAIGRDDGGIVDVLWRQGPPRRRAADVEEVHQVPGRATESVRRVSEVLDAADYARRLREDAVGLREALEREGAEVEAYREERETLVKESVHIERQLRVLEESIKADEAKIKAVRAQEDEATQNAQRQHDRSASQEEALRDLQGQTDALQGEAVRHKAEFEAAKLREAVLVGRITVLRKEQRRVDRQSRQAYGAALAKAKEELDETRQLARKASRAEHDALAQVRSLAGNLQRQGAAVEAAGAVVELLNGELAERRREGTAQLSRLEEARSQERALREELWVLRSRIDELERFEQDHRGLGSDLETAMDEASAQIGTAQRLAKGIVDRSSRAGSGRAWPWR